jgi:hypothetical protein
METILLLTACVNPNGMSYTALVDVDVRKKQYEDALRWYLENTTLRVVFVENTGCDMSDEFIDYIHSGRLEMLTFFGNDYDRSLGKGYGEALILDYGFHNSRFFSESGADILVVKVTGRLFCRNINDIIKKYNSANTVYSNIGKDDWGGDIAGSNFIIAPQKFWVDYFLPRHNELNDSKCFHFEHLLHDSITRWTKDGFWHREFWTLPHIEGVSGTFGVVVSTPLERSFQDKILYLLRRFFNYRGYINPFYKGNRDYGTLFNSEKV